MFRYEQPGIQRHRESVQWRPFMDIVYRLSFNRWESKEEIVEQSCAALEIVKDLMR